MGGVRAVEHEALEHCEAGAKAMRVGRVCVDKPVTEARGNAKATRVRRARRIQQRDVERLGERGEFRVQRLVGVAQGDKLWTDV